MTAGVEEVEVGQLLLDLVHDIARMGGFGGDVLKKECTDLTRRISLLSHLFQEIREFKAAAAPPSSASSSSSSSYTTSLNHVLVSLKAAKTTILVALNYNNSNMILDEAGKQIAFEFQYVTWHLERSLGGFPYDRFDISEEVQEQVELVRAQLKRATERHGPLQKKVLSHALSLENEIDLQEVRNIGNELHDFEPMVDIIPKVNDAMGHGMEQIAMQQLETPKKANASKAEKFSNNSLEETKKPDSVVIPDDFRCPISLEMMRDPVIISTGQTYERSCIQRWIDCGNRTCPKTQQQLSNLSLTPNYVLRSLIIQWCEKNKQEEPIGLTKGRLRKSDGSFQEAEGDMASIISLVNKLSSRSIEERRNAVTTIRSMSKRSTDNRILIAEAGAIPVLLNLLTSEDIVTQENAVTSILNLSIYENNKGLIMLAGAVPSIVQVLRMGSMEARENAAATLFSLSLLDENKITIGASGAIAALVELLQSGSSRGMKDAATALFNLCIYQGNKGCAVRAGVLVPLMKMLTNSSSSMVDEALTLLAVLASHQEGKTAIAKASAIPVLIDLLRTGRPRNKENAAAILLALCKKDTDNLSCMARLGAVIPLTELSKSGTERAKRKATSLLEHLSKLQQL